MVATRLPSAMHSVFSSVEITRSLFGPAKCDAPYGVPPVVVLFSAASVYGSPVINMPWCSNGKVMDSSVDSWPPCIDEVEVNTAAGFPTNDPLSHSAAVPSKKYFIADAMLPNRVGLPMINPSQSARSVFSTYRCPVVGTKGSVCSHAVDTFGTVHITASA